MKFGSRLLILAFALVSTAILVAPAMATSASNTLNLAGGDRLRANAWHSTAYMTTCDWETSSKVLGTHPSYADWVRCNTEIAAHGIKATFSISKSSQINVTFVSKTLYKGYWINYDNWISWSSGSVKPGYTTVWVSAKATASAHDAVFGTPSNLVAYAGAV